MSNADDIRWRQRLEHFDQAMQPLADAMEQDEYSDLERAGVIQLFEVAFEMAWKTLNDLLTYDGVIDATGARTTLRAAHEAGHLDDIDAWLQMLDARNRTTHAYDEATAQSLLEEIKHQAFSRLRDLLGRLNQLRDQREP